MHNARLLKLPREPDLSAVWIDQLSVTVFLISQTLVMSHLDSRVAPRLYDDAGCVLTIAQRTRFFGLVLGKMNHPETFSYDGSTVGPT